MSFMLALPKISLHSAGAVIWSSWWRANRAGADRHDGQLVKAGPEQPVRRAG